jgi:hypothetical protein
MLARPKSRYRARTLSLPVYHGTLVLSTRVRNDKFRVQLVSGLSWRESPDPTIGLHSPPQKNGLVASVRGELPTEGPRGGVRWSARYTVRRAAWHTLDHAWEIEDRIE